MKVYMVEVDNGEQWEDYSSWIDKVFKSHQSAYDYLWNHGYRHYFSQITNKYCWTKEDEFYTFGANIIEMNVED